MDCCAKPNKINSWQLKNKPAGPNEAYQPTNLEHIANIVSHGVAIIPGGLGARLLVSSAADQAQYINAFVYGGAVICLFFMSTVYHTASYVGKFPQLRYYLHVIDRATIYMFIAATYTPWLTLKKIGFFGRSMRYGIWFAAIFGTFYQVKYHEKYKLVETLLYIAIGLLPAVSVYSMDEWSGIGLVALGGLIYLCGLIFFKCDGRIPCAHAIWHLHVVLGAAVQFYAIKAHLISGSIHTDDFLTPEKPGIDEL